MMRITAAWLAVISRSSLATKIWLSIGIFVVGFVLCTVVTQTQGIEAERRLEVASTSLFPAALLSQRAEAGFQRSTKAFRDAVVMLDSPSLDRAMSEGFVVRDNLCRLAAIPGLPSEYRSVALRLATEVGLFLSDSSAAYGREISDPGAVSALDQAKMRDLTARNAFVSGSLFQLKDGIDSRLLTELSRLRTRSARQRWFNLIVLLITIALAAGLVNLTIRRAIMGPLRKVEADLAHERDLLRILLDNIPDYIYFKDAESRFIRVNRAQSCLMGIETEGEAVGRTDFDFFDAEHAEKAYQDERDIVRSGMPLVSKVEMVRSAGSARWVTSTKAPVKDDAGRVHLIVGVSRDCTDWKAATEALQRSEESFRCLFAAIPHPVWVYDAETYLMLEVNPAAIVRYGYTVEEFLELKVPDVYPGEECQRIYQALHSNHPLTPLGGTWKHLTKDGSVLDVEVSVHPLDFRGRTAVVVLAQDVTARKQLEHELHQAQRLEAVGQLAAGIAHEINTPIQYVGDNLRFLGDAFRDRQAVIGLYERLHEAAASGTVMPQLLADLSQAIEDTDQEYLGEEIPKAMQQSLDGVERVATIVRAMKEFAHPGHKDKESADLNRALKNTLLVARNEYKYVADVDAAFGDLPLVICHVADMNQVFLNLLVNAAHAIHDVVKGSQTKGTIGVRTWHSGDQAIISISDTGTGIPEAIRHKVFDPFFTTKPVGTGTGQGLAIARTIVVEKHGGSLRFEPNLPQGTIFTIAIPIQPTAPANPARGVGAWTEEKNEADSVRR